MSAEATKHKHPALVGPGEAGEEKNREVKHCLPPDHEATEGAVLGRFGHAKSPCEDRHGVDIGIAIRGFGRRGVQVGHGVVGVMLGLPPLNREALEEISDDNACKVAVKAVLEDLVVKEVVCEPSALLPEEAHDHSADHVDSEVGRHDCASYGSSKEQQVGCYLVSIVEGGCVEESHGH